MKRLLIIGFGDIARRTIPLLEGYRIYALRRNNLNRIGLSAQQATPIYGDLDDRSSLKRLIGLADAVLHLAPPPDTGTQDIRTRNLLAVLSRGCLPKRLIYISTSGVYGDCGGARVGETRQLNPQSERALRRLDAETEIRHWAIRNGVNASILRVPGIYAHDRLPLERLRSGMAVIKVEEDSYSNHIHADDLARIVVAALSYGKPNRVYHASDDGEMKMGDYFDVVADAYHLPRPQRISRIEAQLAIPGSLLSFMNESRRMTNARMKQELHVRLNFPTVDEALGMHQLAPSA